MTGVSNPKLAAAVTNTGRGLSMDKRNHFRIGMRINRSLQLLGVNRIAPAIRHLDGGRRGTFDIFLHTSVKNTILTNNDFVAALEQINTSGSHTRRSWRR